MNAFETKLSETMPNGLTALGITTIQVNLGRTCDLACRHCHLECSPARTEMMSRTTMDRTLQIIRTSSCDLVDITGGAPELHPDIRPLIEALTENGRRCQVRTNFTALLEPQCEGLMECFRDHRVSLVGSLPCYLEENVDSQRGNGTYRKCIDVIGRLNALGYGMRDDLQLNLVYNPSGASLPTQQSELEAAYRKELRERFALRFSHLLTITNMPIGRFATELQKTGNKETYETTLRETFNIQAVDRVMCRHQVCIDWNGQLYDCDFNIALGLPIDHGAPNTVADYDPAAIEQRQVVTGLHCFGCTAGSGSSCEGSLS